MILFATLHVIPKPLGNASVRRDLISCDDAKNRLGGMPPKREQDEHESLTRIAIVDDQKCKPKKCAQECQKFCPVVRMGE